MRLSPVFWLSAVALLAACDRIALGPQQASSAPPSAPAPPSPTFDPQAGVGLTYADFVAGEGASLAPDALGLGAADRARLWRLMATAQPGELIQGGGAQALVFRGCAEAGCAEGEAVVAADPATGVVFVGVRDSVGVEELVANDRLGALLSLRSPSGHWIRQAPGPA